MGELALYRKYRSATFEAVIGQPHITATLQNAVKSGKLSHAYLFTGPRGVGKTTMARLLARSVNCTGKAEKPCGECLNCQADIGSHLDLLEIDAASNRGIDDARSLREKINLAPSMGKYKVYIIDEVHMLTTEAFNALLKTLEEPPAHAIFILATTEAHKLPETIVSRTQRFQFKPIAMADLEKHLAYIASEEKIEITPEAIHILSTASRGGFRDAISLLDQVATSGLSPLDEPQVRQLLGWTDSELISTILGAILDQDAVTVLAQLDTALGNGAQAAQLADQLAGAVRHKLRGELESAGGEQPSLMQHLVRCIEELIPIAKSPAPELALEAALVRLSLPLAEPADLPIAPVVTAPTPVVAAAKPATPQPVAPAGSEQDQELWVKALSQIKQHNNSLYALLRSSCTVRFEGDEVILGCRFGFHRDRLKESKNLQVIEQALARVYGRRLKALPQLEAAQEQPGAPETDSELVASALEILGGEIVDG